MKLSKLKRRLRRRCTHGISLRFRAWLLAHCEVAPFHRMHCAYKTPKITYFFRINIINGQV